MSDVSSSTPPSNLSDNTAQSTSSPIDNHISENPLYDMLLPENSNKEHLKTLLQVTNAAPKWGVFESSKTGTAIRSFEQGILPAAGGLIGGAAGSAGGTAVAPGAGTIAGGLAGGLAGAYAGQKAQDYLVDMLPESAKQALGVDELQKFADQAHPYASMFGATLPFFIGASPAVSATKLASTATAAERLAANPITQRLISGTVQGGMQAATDLASGQDFDWKKTAIATGLGVVFAGKNALGTRIDGSIADPVYESLVKPTNLIREALGREKLPPTLSELHDARVMGPGATENTYFGTENMPPEAAKIAGDNVKNERFLTGTPDTPAEIHRYAEENHPELFQAHHDLLMQRETILNFMENNEGNVPKSMEDHLDTINKSLDDIESKKKVAYQRAADALNTETVPIEKIKDDVYQGGKSREEQRQAIADDVKTRYMATGRSEEEADAYSKYVASRYIAYSDQYGGKIGSPEELYLNSSNLRAEGQKGMRPQIGAQPINKDQVSQEFSEKIGKASEWKDVIQANKENPTWDKSKKPESWSQGDLVNIGDKNSLMVLDRTEGGQSSLISKPDKDGISKRYEFDEFKGLREAGEVRFDDAIGSIKGLELTQGKAGTIYFPNKIGSRPTITLKESANASTYGHELAHEWLEQMNMGSQHDLAPDVVKQDMQTLKDFLGIKEDQTKISDKQHEKFARSMERYMRDGISPSKNLVGVFEKFKSWLSQIYRNALALGSPISADVRAVMDRMISSDHDRAVIAPENDTASHLAQIHEQDAKEVPPEHVEPAIDRIMYETNRAFEDYPDDIKKDLESIKQSILAKRQPAGEARPAEGNGPGLGGSGKGSGSEPKSGNGGVEHGEINEGGAKNGTERTGLPGEPAGAIGRAEFSPRPNGTPRPLIPTESVDDKLHPFEPRSIPTLRNGEPDYKKWSGSINLNNVDASKEAIDMIVDSGNRNNEFGEYRQNKILSDSEKLSLAEDMNVTLKKFERFYDSARINTANMQVATQIFTKSSENLAEMGFMMKDNPTEENIMNYLNARDNHDQLQAYISGIRSSYGRGLGYLRKPFTRRAADLASKFEEGSIDKVVAERTGRTLNQLLDEGEIMSKLDTPQKVSKFMQDLKKSNWGKYVQEYQVNLLCSGLITHAGYFEGNLLTTLSSYIPERAVQATIGSVKSALGSEAERVHWGEIPEAIKSTGQGILNATESAIKALRTGEQIHLPGENIPSRGDSIMFRGKSYEVTHDGLRLKRELKEGEVEQKPEIGDTVSFRGRKFYMGPSGFEPVEEKTSGMVMNENASWQSLKDSFFGRNLYGAMSGAYDAVKAIPDIVVPQDQKGFSLQYPQEGRGYNPNIMLNGKNFLPLGSIVRSPLERFVNAIHAFNSTLNYTLSKNTLALRQAANEGLEGAAFTSRLAELKQNPPSELMSLATKEAKELALAGQAGKITNKFVDFLNEQEIAGVAPLRIFIPFAKIFSAKTNMEVERSFLGFASPSVRDDIFGRNGSLAQDQALGKMLYGTTISALMAMRYYNGYVNGSGPANPKDRPDGFLPHSVRIGNWWVSTTKLGPIGGLMSLTGSLCEAASMAKQAYQKEGIGSGLEKGVASTIHAIYQNVLEESAMAQFSNVMQAMNEPEKKGEKLLLSLAKSFILPIGIQQAARWSDPYVRDTHTFLESLKAGLPWVSETLPPKLNVWGEPVRRHPTFLGTEFETADQMPDFEKQLYDRGMVPALPPKKILGVPLTEEQHQEYTTTSGQPMKKAFEAFFQSHDIKKMSPYDIHNSIVNIEKNARSIARNALLIKYPEIGAQAKYNKDVLKQLPENDE